MRKFPLPTGLQFVYAYEMHLSMSDIHKKRGRPATGRTPISALRLPDDLREAVDRYVADQPDPKPSRSEAIRYALRDWLTGLGYLPHRDDPEMAN